MFSCCIRVLHLSLSPTLKRGHVALKLVCGEYMPSTIVVFDLQFEFEIELITK